MRVTNHVLHALDYSAIACVGLCVVYCHRGNHPLVEHPVFWLRAGSVEGETADAAVRVAVETNAQYPEDGAVHREVQSWEDVP